MRGAKTPLEVAGVGAIAQRAVLSLALEDGDAIDDRVEGVSGNGVTEMALGVVEVEPLEGAVEALAHEGIEACGPRLSSSILLSQAHSELALGLASLLGDGLGVELRAALSVAVWARAAVVLRPKRRTDSLDASARKAIARACGYLAKRARGPLMRCAEYLRDGLPISTGVIEGAGRYLVKDRMDRTGARWSLHRR